MGFKCGIVGLPNVGKSTLFNALISGYKVNSGNYPFCTIQPNTGNISVPDKRLEKISTIAKSKKMIPTQIEFVDIAGIVRGASNGEGLGNQFLSYIRNVDAIVYVVRCFYNKDIIHVESSVDPIRDTEIIETELILRDIETLNKQMKNIIKKASHDKYFANQLVMINSILKVLDAGQPARVIVDKNNEESIKALNLLTSKPFFYICNVDEKSIANGNVLSNLIKQKAIRQNSTSINLSIQIEEEISSLESQKEKEEFLVDLGLNESALNKVIRVAYQILNLNTYFTAGPEETRAWTYVKGTNAQKAAGIIHTDFSNGFICAEVISCNDYIKYSGERQAKEAGKLNQEGRNYIVQDGDIILFRFNISKSK